MAPIELDMNNEQYTVDIIPSKTVEMIAVMQIIANRRHYEFANVFAESLYKRLTRESRDFIDMLSGLRFPGAVFFGFFLREGIYDDFDRFIERTANYSDTEFIYFAFDWEIPRERIEQVKKKPELLPEIIEELCSYLWGGNEEPVKELIFNTESYKARLLNLAVEIIHDSEFNRIIDGLSDAYRQSEEEIRKRLLKTSPLELVSEIKGKNVAAEHHFRNYVFLPSYFMHEFNITAWDHDDGVFLLFYSIKNSERMHNEEIDQFLSILKSLSDRTRLQILQRLRSKPSYGKKLAEELKLSTASISRQLEQLRSMSLITEEKLDGFKYFKLNRNEIDKLIKSIQEFFSIK